MYKSVNHLLLILSLATAFSSNAMDKGFPNTYGSLLSKAMGTPVDSSGNPTVSPICQQLKTIKYNDPAIEYSKLVSGLAQNNKTVCDCVKEILLKNKFDAARAIDPKWQPDEKPFKTGRYIVICDENLSEKRCLKVKDVFEEKTDVTTIVDTMAIVKVKQKENIPGSARLAIKSFRKTGNKKIWQATLYTNTNEEVSSGTLAHEKVHLDQLHGLKEKPLFEKVNLNLEDERFRKFVRITEKEADWLAISCSANWVKNNDTTFWKNELVAVAPVLDKLLPHCTNPNAPAELKESCKKMFNEIDKKTKKLDPEHPGLASRYFWQIKLARLMTAQELERKEGKVLLLSSFFNNL